MNKNLKSILIINFGGVGDLVLSIPFLRGLKESFEGCHVFLLCAARTGDILKKQPYIDDICMVEMSVTGLMRTCLKLRKKRFDIAINLMPHTSFFASIKIQLLLLLINAKLWAGRNTEGRGFFYDIKIDEKVMQAESEILTYKKLLFAIGGSSFDGMLKYYVPSDIFGKARTMIEDECGTIRYPLIAVNPGSDWPSKRWPIEEYADLLCRLTNKVPSAKFVIIGTKSEMMLADFLKKKVGEAVCILSGKTTLEMLPAIIKNTDLLITNDSGPSHIARAVGIPVVTLSGPSPPAFLNNKSKAESVVINHSVECSPCLKKVCDDMICWNAISVEEVFEKTISVIERIGNYEHNN